MARKRIKPMEMRGGSPRIVARQAAVHEADGGVDISGCPACRGVLPIA